MARIRGRGNATTELVLVRLLRAAKLPGWRRHLSLPGKPDFAWQDRKVAVFVDGCFWHGHRTCGRNLTPVANRSYWQAKIERNMRHDNEVSRSLRTGGWTVLRVWECILKRNPLACILRMRNALDKE